MRGWGIGGGGWGNYYHTEHFHDYVDNISILFAIEAHLYTSLWSCAPLLQEKPNQCFMNSCNKSFNAPDLLQEHLECHFQVPPKKMKVCTQKVLDVSMARVNNTMFVLSDDTSSSQRHVDK